MNNLAIIAQLMRGRDPKEVVMSAVRNGNINNPNVTALIQYAETGDSQQLVNLAQQIFQARGLNLDNEFNNFMSLLK